MKSTLKVNGVLITSVKVEYFPFGEAWDWEYLNDNDSIFKQTSYHNRTNDKWHKECTDNGIEPLYFDNEVEKQQIDSL